MQNLNSLKIFTWVSLIGLAVCLALAFIFPGRFHEPYSAVLYSREGELLGARIAADGQWRFPPLRQVPDRYKTALLLQEDKRFFRHPGVDPLALARALRLDLKARRVVSGGSTLTMQLVRLTRRNPRRSIPEKVFEIMAALGLEMHLRKEEILALYASHAPFGGNVVGLEAAAWRYFGRRPDQLSWAESCLLAVLPNSPAVMHPGRNRSLLQAKRDHLLRVLRARGRLSELELKLALREPLPAEPRPLPRWAPHLLETLVRDRACDGPRFHSTLEAPLQRAVQGIVSRASRPLAREGIQNAAALVIDNRNFSVVAYAGNSRTSEFEGSGYAVDLVRRPRSTGSILKPLLYAAMLQSGDITPTLLVPDVPTRFNGFAPENFDRGYRGAVPAREALARSLNIPAVRLLRDYGIARFQAFLTAMGMTTLFRKPDDYGLTLILGGAEGTLWDLAGLYANLAGVALAPQQAFKGTYRRLRLLKEDRADTGRAAEIGPGAAWLTLQALLEVKRPEEDLYWRRFASARPIAWKTGTSLGQRDAWAIGVTPRYTVAVWVGNATGEGKPGLTGSLAAAPILFEIFNRLDKTGFFPRPNFDLKMVDLCRDDGFLPAAGCATETQWLPRDSTFERASPYHRLIHLDSAGKWRVQANCQPLSRMRHVTWFVLPAAQDYYYRKRQPLYREVPAYRADCRDGATEDEDRSPVAFLYPQKDSRIYLPVDLGMKKEKTIFEAVHRRPDAVLYWHLDGRYLGSTQTFHQQALDMVPGPHLLTVVDQAGNRLARRFEILAKPQR